MPLSDAEKQELFAWMQSQGDKRGFTLFRQYLTVEMGETANDIVRKRGEICDFERGRHEALLWVLETADRLGKLIVEPQKD